MASQGLFFRCLNIATNSRILLSNRISVVNTTVPQAGLKRSIAEKLKELKIPEKPKKPLSPYLRFVREHRDSIARQHPEWKSTDVIRQCAQDWMTSHPTIKEKYNKEFDAELPVYAKKNAEFNSKLTPEQVEALKEAKVEQKIANNKRTLKKQLRDENKPKRPMNAYLLYVTEQAKTQNKSFVEVLTSLKGQWNQLSPSVVEKYQKIADETKAAYEKELQAWERKMINEGKTDLVRVKTLAETVPTVGKKSKKAEDKTASSEKVASKKSKAAGNA